MKKKHAILTLVSVVTLLTVDNLHAQGLIVDQASATLNDLPQNSSLIPGTSIAQSFTPSLGAVGWVQFSQYVPNYPGNDSVTLVVNLHEATWNGPIVSSTDPVILLNRNIVQTVFYFPNNVAVTPGQSYFLEPVVVSGGTLAVGNFNTSTYGGGQAYAGGVPTSTVDFWFREGIVVVPEPGTLVLLFIGLVGFLARARLTKSS